jgi:molybdopterin-containing oxidoreductase family iron-sulfur binding subunit
VSDELVQLRLGIDAPAGWSRRNFLKLMGASLALATGCDRSLPEKILPFSVAPRDVHPGVPRYYATHMLVDGFAIGILGRSNEGRPTKIDGNPDHPASLGGTGLLQQAHLLGLYDPDRAQRVLHSGQPSSWEQLADRLRAPRNDGGAGLRLLLEPSTSPTLHRLLGRLRALHPQLKVTFWSPLPPLDNTLAGAALAFGRPLQPHYDLVAASVIVTLDADLLNAMPMALAHARRWAARRRLATPADEPSRLYAVECMRTPTGLAADHRLRRRASDIAAVAGALAAALPGMARELRAIQAAERDRKFIAAVAHDLASRPPGSTLVVVGERQPPPVHALGLAMNVALGNVGATVRMSEPVALGASDADLGALVADMRAGNVDTLLILDGNPLYTAPIELDLARVLGHVPERIYLGDYENETAAHATWLAPLAHGLESWGDGRAYDGTLSLQQPLIRPLHGGRSIIEVLAMLAGDREPDGHRLVHATHAQLDLEAALQRGRVDGSARLVTPRLPAADAIARAAAALPTLRDGELELDFYASPTLHDGRYANNAWLLEQPEPITKLTWDNAALLSPRTAARLGLDTQDVVELISRGRSLEAPVLVVPGHADDAVSLWLGYGRQGAESLAAGVGVNAYALRTATAPAFARDLRIVATGGTHQLARTQLDFLQHGRDIALATTLAAYRQDPDFTRDNKGALPSLMPPVPYHGVQWAMSIDLSICTGCSACMLACQSENNLAVVGKAQILKRRDMHWLRIDTYYHGAVDEPHPVNQPMLCQHCETAPCEYVCPVNATVHSPDGLNEMIYNRCVGTRFCSNNCPYKVRRFNWFNWNKHEPANQGLYELAHNPDVTVRDRGVMEKCTYCVQRIRAVEIRARLESRDIRPGEVVTACQAACPTGAIQFDSLSHPDTAMVRWRNEPRAYAVLHDQGTRPRTQYLARIDNPNQELET